MHQIHGNLLTLAKEGRFDLIVHGCNCLCAMGKGIALDIKNQFPEAYAADRATVRGDRTKLGTYSKAVIERPNVTFTIVNAYTQFSYLRSKNSTFDYRGKPDTVNADYEAIDQVFARIAQDFPAHLRIGYPLIGAGLAGGDWTLIEPMIERHLGERDHTLVIYDQSKSR